MAVFFPTINQAIRSTLHKFKFDEVITAGKDVYTLAPATGSIAANAKVLGGIFTAGGNKNDEKPQTVHALLDKGKHFMAMNMARDAAVVFEKALEKDPASKEAQIELALSYLAIDRFKESQEIIKKLYKDNPNDPAVLVAYARILIKEKKYKEARNILEKLILTDPDNYRVHFYYAMLNLDETDLPAAEKAILKAIELNPQYSILYYILINVYSINKGYKDSAMKKVYEVYAKYQPYVKHEIFNQSPLHCSFALELSKLNRYKEACEEFERCFKDLSPYNAGEQISMNYLYALSLNYAGKRKDGERYFEEAKRLYDLTDHDPAYSKIYEDVCKISSGYQSERKDYKKVIEILKGCLAKLPDSIKLNKLQGNAYFVIRDAEHALEYYEKVLALDKSQHDVHYMVGLIYGFKFFNSQGTEQQGFYKKAKTAYEMAISIKAEEEYLNGYLLVLLANGDQDDLYKVTEKFKDKKFQDPELNCQMGEALLRTADYDRSLQYLEKALSSVNNGDELKEEILILTANAYFRLEQFDKATEVYDRIYHLKDLSDDTRLDLANAYAIWHHIIGSEREECLKRAVELAEGIKSSSLITTALKLSVLALVYAQLGLKEEAMSALAELSKNSLFSRIEIAVRPEMLMQLGEYEGAIKAGDEEYRSNKQILKDRRPEEKMPASCGMTTVEEITKLSDLLYHLRTGMCYREMGRRKEALANYDEVLKIKPECGYCHAYYAEALDIQSDQERIENEYQLAMHYEPKNHKVMFSYARYLAAIEKYEESADVLKTILERFPKHDDANDLLGLINLVAVAKERDATYVLKVSEPLLKFQLFYLKVRPAKERDLQIPAVQMPKKKLQDTDYPEFDDQLLNNLPAYSNQPNGK